MPIIVVGGSSRGAGKTALVCGLIATLPEFRWTAVKISTHDHGLPKPIWEETQPGQGTDTARYLAAGAHRALLVTAQPDELGPIARQLLLDPEPHTHTIFESNSILRHVEPDLCLIVHGESVKGSEQTRPKPSFAYALRHADAMVSHSDADRVIPDGLYLAGEEPRPIFHLAALDQISPEMQSWVLSRLDSNPHL